MDLALGNPCDRAVGDHRNWLALRSAVEVAGRQETGIARMRTVSGQRLVNVLGPL